MLFLNASLDLDEETWKLPFQALCVFGLYQDTVH